MPLPARPNSNDFRLPGGKDTGSCYPYYRLSATIEFKLAQRKAGYKGGALIPLSELTKVSVILPTYDERDNIQILIYQVLKYIGNGVEIVVVDDDSPDGTWRLVQDIATTDPRVRLLRRIGRRGLTSAIREGISMARGDIICWMDCDLSMPPKILPALVQAMRENDIAVGSRYVRGGNDVRDSSLRVISSKVVNYLASLLLRTKTVDLTSGFLAVRRAVFNTLSLNGGYGDYCIDFLCRAERAGFKLVEIPYACLPRQRGVTKTDPSLSKFLHHGLTYVATIVRLFLAAKTPISREVLRDEREVL